MKKMITLLALVATACSPVLAGPIKNNVIPADAKIVAHINMDDFRASKLAELSKVIEGIEGIEKDVAQATDSGSGESAYLIKIGDKLGFDPTTELVSLTVYSNDLDVKKGSVIIAESANPVMDEAKFVEAIKSEANDTPIESAKTGDTTIYTIGQGASHSKFSFIDTKTIMLSDTDDRLTKALKLYSSESGTFKAIDKAPAGSLFTLQVTGIKEAMAKSMDTQNPDPLAIMFQNIKSVTCFAGEDQGTAFLNIRVATDTPDAALQLSQMAQGMLPMLTLRTATRSNDLASILQKLTITPEDSNIVVSLKHPAEDLIATVKKVVIDINAVAARGVNPGFPAGPGAPATPATPAAPVAPAAPAAPAVQ